MQFKRRESSFFIKFIIILFLNSVLFSSNNLNCTFSDFLLSNQKKIVSSITLSIITYVKTNKNLPITFAIGTIPWLLKINKVEEAYKFLMSVMGFHVISWIHSSRFGSSLIFHKVIRGKNIKRGIFNNKIIIEQDNFGNIIKVDDNNKTPIILGAIPRTKAHIEELRAKFNLKENERIAIYSFNRAFERNWAGLTDLIEKDNRLDLFLYPTTDYAAPTLIDLIRVVRDLSNRDSLNYPICYVQCKVGHGRSRVAIAAYIFYLCNKIKKEVNIEQVEYYLNLFQPQVHFHRNHILALIDFKEKLKKSESFEKLYSKYKEEVDQRDKEFINNNFN